MNWKAKKLEVRPILTGRCTFPLHPAAERFWRERGYLR